MNREYMNAARRIMQALEQRGHVAPCDTPKETAAQIAAAFEAAVAHVYKFTD